MTEPTAADEAGVDLDDAARARATVGTELRRRLAVLAATLPEDDGSFVARLSDRPGLVASILGRDLLDPLEVPVDGELPAPAAELVRVVGTVGVGDLDATIDAIAMVRARVNALEAVEGLLLERVRRQALRAEVLDESELMVRTATGDQRRDLARRAVVADIALAVREQEHQVAARMDRAHALAVRAPRTLAGALAGRVSWANAARVADAVAELEPGLAGALDGAVAHAASCQNPRQFARTVRRTYDRLHPTPPQVRHAEAATRRGVWVDPGRDGMAYLTLYAPAPAVHAARSRLDDVARQVRSGGDARTLAQLRADVMTALVLDDGTLDLTAAGPAGAAGNVSAEPGPIGGDAPTDGRTAPHLAVLARAVRPRIYVTVPVLTLLGRSDEPGMLDGTVPVDADTARALAGLAPSFTRILTHPVTGDVLGVDVRTYVPPAALRHHLVVRDTTCRFPGCQRPAAATDADHTDAHARGGPTTDANLALLCRHHHVIKHRTRFEVRQHPDGTGSLTWTTPTGRTYVTHPEPVPATLHTSTPHPMHVPAPDLDDEPPF